MSDGEELVVGFGELVAKSTGQIKEEPVADLKKIILDRYGRKEDRPPPSLDSFYYRASGLAYVCPRQEVLQAKYKVGTKIRKGCTEIANYDVGSGMHYAMQNLILPKIGVIRGAWRCLECGKLHGAWKAGDPRPCYEVAIPRPDHCFHCNHKEFLFEEYHLVDSPHGTGGHMDGILVLPGAAKPGLFELKSISQSGAKKIRQVPQIEHVVQANVYMRMAGLTWAKILYWVKGVYSADKNLIEHHLEPDDEVWDGVLKMLGSIRHGMKTGELPDRICAHRMGSTAQECPVLNQCFGDGEPDDAAGLI